MKNIVIFMFLSVIRTGSTKSKPQDQVSENSPKTVESEIKYPEAKPFNSLQELMNSVTKKNEADDQNEFYDYILPINELQDDQKPGKTIETETHLPFKEENSLKHLKNSIVSISETNLEKNHQNGFAQNIRQNENFQSESLPNVVKTPHKNITENVKDNLMDVNPVINMSEPQFLKPIASNEKDQVNKFTDTEKNLTNKEDLLKNTEPVPNTNTLKIQNDLPEKDLKIDTQETKKRLKSKKSKKKKKANARSGKGKRKSKDSKRKKKKKKTTKVTNRGDLSKVDLPQGDDPNAYFTDLFQGDDPNAYFTEYANNEDTQLKFDDKTIVDKYPVVKSELNDVYLKADSDKPHDNDLKVVSDKPHTAADHIQNKKFQAPQNGIQNVKSQNIIMLAFDVSKTRH